MVYAKWIGPNGTVCAIEADEDNCKRIHDNIALNSKVNIGVFHNVIAEKGGVQIPFSNSECVACDWRKDVKRSVTRKDESACRVRARGRGGRSRGRRGGFMNTITTTIPISDNYYCSLKH